MNNEILILMQELIMEIKHSSDENRDIQLICEKLDDAIDRELNTASERWN